MVSITHPFYVSTVLTVSMLAKIQKGNEETMHIVSLPPSLAESKTVSKGKLKLSAKNGAPKIL